MSSADKEAAAAIQASAGAAVEAMKAGRHDEAIAKFQEVIAKVPTCTDCYYNIGVSQMAKQQYTEAEASFKKAIELKPDNADAYTALANLYNSQKKFDLAAEASANAAKYSSAAGGGGNAEASYNQGVILFNAGKFAEAKTQFEAATKTDPNHAMAQYQLGMTSLNLGQIPGSRRRARGVSQGGSERSESGGSEGGTAGTAADAQEVGSGLQFARSRKAMSTASPTG